MYGIEYIAMNEVTSAIPKATGVLIPSLSILNLPIRGWLKYIGSRRGCLDISLNNIHVNTISGYINDNALIDAKIFIFLVDFQIPGSIIEITNGTMVEDNKIG